MRRPVDVPRLERFMEALGREADREARVYLTGGATALLYGWRETTLDVDVRFEPDSDRLLRSIPEIKENLEINLELASPIDFIPPLRGWQERSRFIARHGRLSFHHFDFDLQALAKIERGHAKDLADVWAMIRLGLVDAASLDATFLEIEPNLYRFPALDPASFRRAVEEVVEQARSVVRDDAPDR